MNPDTAPSDLDQIKALLARSAFVSPADISPATDLFDDLDIDSLGLIETFTDLERIFKIKLDPTRFTRDEIRTPEKLLALIRIQTQS